MKLADIPMMIPENRLVFLAEDQKRNIGALVCDPFQICQEINEHHTAGCTAVSSFQTVNMAILQRYHHVINHFFQRFDSFRAIIRHGSECIDSDCSDFQYRISYHFQFFPRFPGKLDSLLIDCLRCFHDVYCMVADSFKICAALHQDIDILVVAVRLNIFRKIHQICVHLIRKLIQIIFIFIYDIDSVRFKPHQKNAAAFQILQCNLTHTGNGLIGFSQCHGRYLIQFGIRNSQICTIFFILRIRFDNRHRKFHQETGERNQCDCCQHIKQRLEICNPAAVYNASP